MSADRQRRYAERNAKGGLVRVAVWVPADRAEELRAFARSLCGQAPPARRRRAAPDPEQLGLLPAPPDEAAPEAPPSRSDDAERPPQRGGC